MKHVCLHLKDDFIFCCSLYLFHLCVLCCNNHCQSHSWKSAAYCCTYFIPFRHRNHWQFITDFCNHILLLMCLFFLQTHKKCFRYSNAYQECIFVASLKCHFHIQGERNTILSDCRYTSITFLSNVTQNEKTFREVKVKRTHLQICWFEALIYFLFFSTSFSWKTNIISNSLI